MSTIRTSLRGLLAVCIASAALANLPVTGRYIPQLASVDAEMQSFMADYSLTGGVLAIMKDDCVIYQRGFGYDFFNDPLPEITPMRLASVSKALCATAAYDAAARGLFDLSDFAFDLGQTDGFGNLVGGILPVAPWPSLGDAAIADITVQHLIDHSAGFAFTGPWNGQWVFGALEISGAMGVGSPPGAVNTLNFALGQPLEYAPGMDMVYTNIAYLALSEIIEERSGMQFIDYVRQNVLTPDMWVPSTDLRPTRTFRFSQSPREPLYIGAPAVTSIFNPNGPTVPECYGGIDYEQATGYAGVVASAAPLLRHLQIYNWSYNGSLPGTSTTIRNYDDGVRIVLLLNSRQNEPQGEHLASLGRARVYSVIETLVDDPAFAWPTFCVDGFWLNFNASTSGTGGYSDPFHSLTTALQQTTDGSKLRLRPGSTTWTGTISQKVLIDAPFGTARIGD